MQTICIVGTGFRGLGIFERIYAYAKHNRGLKPIQVHLIDPAIFGPEQYDIRQPDYLLLNIVCGQASIFPDAISVPSCPPTTGPSLFEWACQRDLRIAEDGFTVGNKGRKIEYGDFLPRRLLGEYLLWFKELIKTQAALFIDIVEHNAKAIDIFSSNNRYNIKLSNGGAIDADYLFITVGQIPITSQNHFRDESRARYIVQPYPLPIQLEYVKPNEIIAISGLGLTALDAILTLTIGRGGKIQKTNGVDKYIPSGNEPQIIAFSRSGFPYRSRPSLGAPLKYDPVIFTPSAIDELRNKLGLELDYDRDILPLIFTELRIAYHRAKYGREFGWEKTPILMNRLNHAVVNNNLEALLTELDKHDTFEFDPKTYLLESFSKSNSENSIALTNDITYQEWICKRLENDLQESRKGTAFSPLKSALEACREFRDIIRYAVEFGGLTKQSSEKFFSHHSQILNRIGVGPQKEHTAIMLALVREGVLHINLGPNPKLDWDNSLDKWKLTSSKLKEKHEVFADWIFQGYFNRNFNINFESSIVGAMARKGLLRIKFPESSIINAVDVDRFFHPISQNGIANERIWIMGLLCEGVTFYNGYVTSPEKFVRSQYDADFAVSKVFSQLI